MPPALHQFVAGFQHHDAISNEARFLQERFRAWGYTSEIFSEQGRVLPELRREVRDIYTYKRNASPEDICLLHLSTGSLVNDVFATLPGRKVVLYHNITPWEFLAGVNEQQARMLREGREQVRRLAGKVDRVLAHSRFSASELEAMGHRDVRVLPLLLDFSHLEVPPHAKTLKEYDDGLTNVLFVGREVPNKRIIDFAHAFHYFQKFVNPKSRLIYVGSTAGMEAYHAMLLTRFVELMLDEVCLLGDVEQDVLNACYRSADVFLCMSEHEGFCIPILEAMHFDVPVMAYDAGAVPETMGGSGIVFREKQFDVIAEMMGRVTTDTSFKEHLLRGQRQRLAAYRERDLEHELREHLGEVLK